jgi:hypothetical protein
VLGANHVDHLKSAFAGVPDWSEQHILFDLFDAAKRMRTRIVARIAVVLS